MDRKKVKLIIAKEGLIFVAIALALYFFKTFAFSLPFPYPKYRLEFQDGSSNIIEIYPDIKSAELVGKRSPNELVKHYHCPGRELVAKRTEKFIRDNKKGSPLVDARCVNEKQLYWYRVYFNFLFQPLIFRTLTIYLFLLLLRFIFWAVEVLWRK